MSEESVFELKRREPGDPIYEAMNRAMNRGVTKLNDRQRYLVESLIGALLNQGSELNLSDPCFKKVNYYKEALGL